MVRLVLCTVQYVWKGHSFANIMLSDCLLSDRSDFAIQTASSPSLYLLHMFNHEKGPRYLLVLIYMEHQIAPCVLALSKVSMIDST
jgi:hypothetical protein